MTCTLPKTGALLKVLKPIAVDKRSSGLIIPKNSFIMYLDFKEERDVQWDETDYKYTFIWQDKVYKTLWTTRSPQNFFQHIAVLPQGPNNE